MLFIDARKRKVMCVKVNSSGANGHGRVGHVHHAGSEHSMYLFPFAIQNISVRADQYVGTIT